MNKCTSCGSETTYQVCNGCAINARIPGVTRSRGSDGTLTLTLGSRSVPVSEPPPLPLTVRCPRCNTYTDRLFYVDWHPGEWCAQCQTNASGDAEWWRQTIITPNEDGTLSTQVQAVGPLASTPGALSERREALEVMREHLSRLAPEHRREALERSLPSGLLPGFTHGFEGVMERVEGGEAVLESIDAVLEAMGTILTPEAPEVELLPCPHCGECAELDDLSRSSPLVRCIGCHLLGPYPDRDGSKWNEVAAMPGRIAELEAALTERDETIARLTERWIDERQRRERAERRSDGL